MVLYMINLKKYGVVLLGAAIVAGTLSGCGTSMNLSEKEQSLVAEYAAQIVLKHDKNYISKLEKVTTDSETTDKSDLNSSEEETTKAEDISSSGTETLEQNDFSGAFGFEPVSVTYTGLVLCDSYPQTDEMTFKLNATENTKLLVLKLNAANKTENPVDVKMMSSDTSIKAKLNDGSSYSALLTLLLDGLNTFNGTLQAGENKELVLVFEVPVQNEGDIQSLQLNVTGNGQNESFDLR